MICGGFEHCKRPAGIAVCLARDHLPRVVVQLEILSAESALLVEQCAINHRADVALGERIQHEHAHSREECVIQLEGWILRRRADECDRSRFYMRAEMRLVEPC